MRIQATKNQVHLANPTNEHLEWVDFNFINQYGGVLKFEHVKDNKLGVVSARKDEASISNDSDADGVVDFDEINRFKVLHLNFKSNDSDGDGENDKLEIKKYYKVK